MKTPRGPIEEQEKVMPCQSIFRLRKLHLFPISVNREIFLSRVYSFSMRGTASFSRMRWPQPSARPSPARARQLTQAPPPTSRRSLRNESNKL